MALLFNDIEKWFCTEPSCFRRTDRFVGVNRIIFVDFDSLTTPSSGSSVRHELCMTALFQANEPKDCGLYGGTYGQETVILQQSSLFIPETSRNVLAFLLGKDNAVETLI